MRRVDGDGRVRIGLARLGAELHLHAPGALVVAGDLEAHRALDRRQDLPRRRIDEQHVERRGLRRRQIDVRALLADGERAPVPHRLPQLHHRRRPGVARRAHAQTAAAHVEHPVAAALAFQIDGDGDVRRRALARAELARELARQPLGEEARGRDVPRRTIRGLRACILIALLRCRLWLPWRRASTRRECAGAPRAAAACCPAMAPSTWVTWSTLEPTSLPGAMSKRYSAELLPDSFCIAVPCGRLPS